MKKSDLEVTVTREELSAAIEEKLPRGEPRHRGHAGHSSTSVRQAEYKGHQIRIETTYVITLDGEPVGGHVVVGDNGRVHYHSIPNQEFLSAVDMVKRVIDLSPAAGEEAAGGEEGY